MTSPASTRLTVIVPAYNGSDVIVDSLASVRQYARCKLVVVDNASTDGTVEVVRRSGLADEIIARPVNGGFGTACNAGAAAATSEFLLLLNQDARLAEPLDDVIDVAANLENAALCGFAMMSREGVVRPSVQRFPRLSTVLSRRRSLVSVKLNGGESPLAFIEVDYFEASCLLAKRSAWERVGGMDESYFMYGEERDLAFRVKTQGMSVLFFPGKHYYHDGGYSPDRAPLIIEGLRHFVDDHVTSPRRIVYVATMRSKALVRLGMAYVRVVLAPRTARRERDVLIAREVWRASGARRS